MEDLHAYLRLPDNQRLYSAGLTLFVKYAMATHSQHYAKLATGPFVDNPSTLLFHLQVVAAAPPVVPAQPTVIRLEQPKAAANSAPKNSAEIDVTIQLRKLRHQRMQTSQKFHSCADGQEGNAERALVCDHIDALSVKIKKLEKDLIYLKQYGHLPPKDEEIRFDALPTTIDDARAERARLASHILKVEKRIIHLDTLPPNSSKRKQMPKQEEKLRALVARNSEIRMLITKLKQIEDDGQT